MEGMNVEAYRRLANVKDVIDLWTPRILIEEMGKEEAIRTIGEEEVIRTIGEEEVIRTIGEDAVIRTIGEKRFAQEIGRERLRQLLDEMDREEEDPTPDAG